MILIEHKLREFMRLVERVIALDFGEVIARGFAGRHRARIRAVIEAYIGRDDDQAEPAHAA